MPNKAIHQLPYSATRQDDDRLYVVRSGADYQIPMASLAPQLLSQTTVIPAADVLTLHSDPVQVVDNAPAGFVAFPVRAVIQFGPGSTNYAVNTGMVVGSTTTVSDTNYSLFGDISDRSTAVGMYQGATNKMVGGDSLSAYVTTGNPTTGDANITITVYYYLIPV